MGGYWVGTERSPVALGGHWGDIGGTGGPAVTPLPQPRCRPRLRMDVAPSPEFHREPGPRAVPAGGRVFLQVSLSRAPPGLGFSLRRCFVSPRSSPVPPRGPPPVPRPLVVLRGGCGAGGGPGGVRRRLRGSFVLPARFPEPLQFLHCRLRLCRQRGGTGTPGGLPTCRAEPCPRRGGGASGSGPAPRPRPRGGPAPGRALRTVTRPIVVTLGTAATPAPGAPPGLPPLPFPPPPPFLRPPPPPQERPRDPPVAPAVPPGAVAAVSFGAFMVGAALAGGLWLVHGRTAPQAPLTSALPPSPGSTRTTPSLEAVGAHRGLAQSNDPPQHEDKALRRAPASSHGSPARGFVLMMGGGGSGLARGSGAARGPPASHEEPAPSGDRRGQPGLARGAAVVRGRGITRGPGASGVIAVTASHEDQASRQDRALTEHRALPEDPAPPGPPRKHNPPSRGGPHHVYIGMGGPPKSGGGQRGPLTDGHHRVTVATKGMARAIRGHRGPPDGHHRVTGATMGMARAIEDHHEATAGPLGPAQEEPGGGHGHQRPPKAPEGESGMANTTDPPPFWPSLMTSLPSQLSYHFRFRRGCSGAKKAREVPRGSLRARWSRGGRDLGDPEGTRRVPGGLGRYRERSGGTGRAREVPGALGGYRERAEGSGRARGVPGALGGYREGSGGTGSARGVPGGLGRYREGSGGTGSARGVPGARGGFREGSGGTGSARGVPGGLGGYRERSGGTGRLLPA
ncbi:transforming growth factor-beta receptor type 3-like protein [Cinclus cinclus]|uniref:transforming growth factor-beta receptor type 3-like protein n=1 Tax=Cinclus cinclus TaxID=127875 RepID=UPI002E153106